MSDDASKMMIPVSFVVVAAGAIAVSVMVLSGVPSETASVLTATAYTVLVAAVGMMKPEWFVIEVHE